MLDGSRSVINRRPLIGKASLEEILLDVAAQILEVTRMIMLMSHFWSWTTRIILPLAMETDIFLARSSCSGNHPFGLLTFGCIVDKILHISRHVENFTDSRQAGRILLITLRNDLVHGNADVEVLGLLESRMILHLLGLTRRRSSPRNHWTHHALARSISLRELLLGLGQRLVEHVA